MKTLARPQSLWVAALVALGGLAVADAHAAQDNRSPQISIVWPRQGDSFSLSTSIKIKADASDPDGSVAQVRFFAGTNLVGVVSDRPFNAIWQVDVNHGSFGTWNLTAIAVDDLGASTESDPVEVKYYLDPPPAPVLQIVAPPDGVLFAAPATFVFSAELLASLGDTGPVEFFVDTNSVGLVDQGTAFSASTPPSSITVSNLVEGEHKLTVRYRSIDGVYCTCVFSTNTVRVVKLGVHLAGLTPDGRIQFEVVTSFPGRQTMIQASPNLLDWVPVSTNQPLSNTFTFTDPNPATNARRFYRALVPP